jgi:hypothetical protein
MPQLVPRVNVPAIQPTTQTVAIVPVIWGVGPQYSYDTNTFLFNDAMDLVLGDEAIQLSQWITNALITPRLAQYIHGLFFGSDFDLLMGKSYATGVVRNLCNKYVRAALSVDNRIKSVLNVDSAVYLRSVIIIVTISVVPGRTQQFEIKWSVP